MIIVKDIQDALTMKKKLSSLVRRSVNFNKDKKDILVELMLLVEELDKNVDPASTLQVVDALVRAGKDFEFFT